MDKGRYVFFIFETCISNDFVHGRLIFDVFKVLFRKCFYFFFDALMSLKWWKRTEMNFLHSKHVLRTICALIIIFGDIFKVYFVVFFFLFLLTIWWAWTSEERQKMNFVYSKYVLRTIYVVRIIFDVFKVLYCSCFFCFCWWNGEKGQRWMIYIHNTSWTRFENP